MPAAAGRTRSLWWPVPAVAATFALGWAVGTRSTPLDDWFHRFGHTPARALLFLTDPWLLTVLLVFGVAVALCAGRRRLAAVMVVAPLVGIVLVQLLKRVFGRYKGPSLAYPSGHTATAVIVVGMLVLLAGAAWWAVLVGAIFVMLAMIGQGVTYHYFTDTVGAVLLGVAVTALAVPAAKLDTRQPECDADHTAR